MAEVERGKRALALVEHGGDRVAEERHLGDLPAAAAGRQFEQALAGPDVKPIRHLPLLAGLHRPPFLPPSWPGLTRPSQTRGSSPRVTIRRVSRRSAPATHRSR